LKSPELINQKIVLVDSFCAAGAFNRLLIINRDENIRDLTFAILRLKKEN
jgi:hypothetical protein